MKLVSLHQASILTVKTRYPRKQRASCYKIDAQFDGCCYMLENDIYKSMYHSLLDAI